MPQIKRIPTPLLSSRSRTRRTTTTTGASAAKEVAVGAAKKNKRPVSSRTTARAAAKAPTTKTKKTVTKTTTKKEVVVKKFSGGVNIDYAKTEELLELLNKINESGLTIPTILEGIIHMLLYNSTHNYPMTMDGNEFNFQEFLESKQTELMEFTNKIKTTVNKWQIAVNKIDLKKFLIELYTKTRFVKDSLNKYKTIDDNTYYSYTHPTKTHPVNIQDPVVIMEMYKYRDYNKITNASKIFELLLSTRFNYNTPPTEYQQSGGFLGLAAAGLLIGGAYLFYRCNTRKNKQSTEDDLHKGFFSHYITYLQIDLALDLVSHLIAHVFGFYGPGIY